jgi:MscS family membrane protein
MNEISALLQRPFWGATVGDYFAFLLFLMAGVLLRKPLAKGIMYLASRIIVQEHVTKNRPLFRSLLQKPLEGLILTLFLFIAFNFIEEPLSKLALFHWKRKDGAPGVTLAGLVGHVFSLMAIIYLALLVSHIIEFAFTLMMEHAKERKEREREQLFPLLRDVTKIVVWTVAMFCLLGIVFNVNIPALITGLGIGGVALALAAKESLENLLASFTILADKPFVLGDSIRISNMEGKVERIGFRSTRIRNKEGIELIVPNRNLISDSLENLSGREKRKITLTIPLRYNLSQEELQKMIESLREHLDKKPELRSKSEITVASYDEKSMKLQIVYRLPQDYTDAQVQSFKDKLNLDVYASILPAMKGADEEV